jgi:hypothetical protein
MEHAFTEGIESVTAESSRAEYHLCGPGNISSSHDSQTRKSKLGTVGQEIQKHCGVRQAVALKSGNWIQQKPDIPQPILKPGAGKYD